MSREHETERCCKRRVRNKRSKFGHTLEALNISLRNLTLTLLVRKSLEVLAGKYHGENILLEREVWCLGKGLEVKN